MVLSKSWNMQKFDISKCEQSVITGYGEIILINN